MTTTKKALLAFFGGSFTAIISVAVIYCYLPESSIVKFNRLGTVGDTIGGIAGPLLNLAGMLIVYFSLQEQLNANNTQYKALQLEIGRSSSEVVLKTAEQSIDNASAEIRNKLDGMKSLAGYVSRFDDGEGELNPGRAKEKNDYVRKQDDKLFEVAMLLTLAYNKVFSNDFPPAYKLLVVRRYHVECIMPLDEVILKRHVKTQLQDDSIKHLYLIMNMKNHFLADREGIYQEAWKMSDAPLK